MFAEIAEFIREGGPFMYINLIVSMSTVAVITERTYRLYFRYSIHRSSFMEQAERLILAGCPEQAVALCDSLPDPLLPRIVKAGLLALHKGKTAISSALEEALLEHTPPVQRRVQTMWSLANIGTLIGLIGTIVGLIGAFKAVGMATPENKTVLLTAGISEAMNNTAFGLSIAVTNIIGHLFLSGQARHLVDDIDFAAVRMENLLTNRSRLEIPVAPEASARVASGALVDAGARL